MEFQGSFLGFTYNDIHSSRLNLVRTSNGLTDNQLVPNLKDKVQETTKDGTIYFGTTYAPREFKIEFAFYQMTEEQLSFIKKFYCDKKIHNLIFDEDPYKIYSAKATGSAFIKHICFERDNKRFYNGEGEITFTCYYPFARGRFKYIDDYVKTTFNANSYLIEEDTEGWLVAFEKDLISLGFTKLEDYNDSVNFTATLYPVEENVLETIENINEWEIASDLQPKGYYETLDGELYSLYNSGDLPLNVIYYFHIEKIQGLELEYNGNKISFENKPYAFPEDIKFLKIDMKEHLIVGCTIELKDTIRLYNFLMQGDFFAIPAHQESKIKITNLSGGCLPDKIEFNYLYL